MGRLARVASMGVRASAGALVDPSGGSAAGHVAEALGSLRGLAAKVGQMTAYVDGLVPEAQQAAYERNMKALLTAAPRSPAASIRACVEEQLGAPIDRLFARWSDEPFASASIGQVHEAVMPDGREVAVKVQHPGVVEAIESDLATAAALGRVFDVLDGKRTQSKRLLATMRQRFLEEVDYLLEGEHLSRFATLHAGDATIRVPSLVHSHSTRRVLTTGLVRGATFDEACAAEPDARRAWASTMWRFVFKGALQGSLLNVDPHPGNYIFHPGGVVTFLDHGCVQTVGQDHWLFSPEVHRAALARDRAAFDRGVARLVASKPGRLERAFLDYAHRCYEPLFVSPCRITREYAAGLLADLAAAIQLGRDVAAGEFFDLPPEALFTNRLQFGFYSVLARLDVDVDYAQIERTIVGGEPG
jgi:predicted unusual protein kinase regulating ubiquinone biosynthesis (AarF/ABC1/UbiB family)